MKSNGLGEREIISLLTERFDFKPELPLGFDDDVAAFPLSRDRLVVLKTDMLVGSTDVPPGMSLKQAAQKAIVATVSDFAAKGVRPSGLLVSLGLVPPVKHATVREIAAGLAVGAGKYGCRIIGGDTGEAEDFIIDCIGFGFAERSKILRRDGARPGDVVAVTGKFGKTSAGLRILLSEKHLSRRFPGLVNAVLHPEARLKTGLELARTGSVNSSIDSSDGLAWSLHEIALLSKVNIALKKIPIASDVEAFAREAKLSADDLALFGGEEYELVLTIGKDRFDAVRRRIPSMIRIGIVKKGNGEVTREVDGRVIPVEPHGYQHFR